MTCLLHDTSAACRHNNEQHAIELDVYGLVQPDDTWLARRGSAYHSISTSRPQNQRGSLGCPLRQCCPNEAVTSLRTAG